VCWPAPERRAKALSVTLLGQPAAWVVGMPIGGLLSEAGWRLSLVVPLFACAAAAVALRATRADRSEAATATAAAAGAPASPLAGLARDRGLATWMASELLAMAGWGCALLFAGALLAEEHGVRVSLAAVMLGAGAIAYMPGNQLARRWVETKPRELLVVFGVGTGAAALALYAVPLSLPLAAIAFALLCFTGGARVLAGSAAGLRADESMRLAVMSIRGATMHFGFLVGSATGGVALAAGGYPAVGATIGVLFGLAIVPHVVALGGEALSRRSPRPPSAASRPRRALPRAATRAPARSAASGT
jgi:predicted MFS family arabinose efflux permease